MSASAAFKNFKQDHLKEIVRKKGFVITEKGSALAGAIADEVTLAGLQILLRCLKLETLVEISKDFADKEKNKTKNSLIKQTMGKLIDRDSAKKFFNALDKPIRVAMKDTLGITPTAASKQDGELLLAEAEAMGLENCFSTFEVGALLNFAEGCGLDVDTHKKDDVIDCLVHQKDFKPEKKDKKAKEKKEEPLSKKKPDIKKGINITDLYSWYTVDELIKYCQDEKIPHGGKKSIVIKRILAYLAGEDVQPKPKAPKKRKAPPSPKKSKRPAKKSKTEKDGEKSGEKSVSEEAMDTSEKEKSSEGPKKRGRKPKATTSSPSKSESEKKEPKKDTSKDKKKEKEKEKSSSSASSESSE